MRRKSQETRNSIINAAISCYKSYGVNGSSMDIIAAEAGTTKPTVYAHFGSKDKLFEEIHKMLQDRKSFDAMKPYIKGVDVEKQLFDFFYCYLKDLLEKENLELLRAIFVEKMRLKNPALFEQVYREEIILKQWLQDASDDGAIVVNDIDIMMYNLWAIPVGLFFWPALIGIKPVDFDVMSEKLEQSLSAFIKPYKLT